MYFLLEESSYCYLENDQLKKINFKVLNNPKRQLK